MKKSARVYGGVLLSSLALLAVAAPAAPIVKEAAMLEGPEALKSKAKADYQHGDLDQAALRLRARRGIHDVRGQYSDQSGD